MRLEELARHFDARPRTHLKKMIEKLVTEGKLKRVKYTYFAVLSEEAQPTKPAAETERNHAVERPAHDEDAATHERQAKKQKKREHSESTTDPAVLS